jgi:hypothetical protein
MRFMIMVLVPAEGGAPPDPKAFEEMDKFNEEGVRAGVLLTYEGLHPTSKGARLRIPAAGEVTVIDGPFTESKEMIAGYMLIQVKSKEEAIAWMKRAPFGGPGEVELRQVMDLDDFAPLDPTGELRTKEVEMRKIMASTQLNAYLSTTG